MKNPSSPPILIALSLLALLLASTPVAASTIDLTDPSSLNVLIPSGEAGSPVAFSTAADGVTFTFTATANLASDPNFVGLMTNPGIGLRLGGGNQSTIAFTLEADARVRLESYSTVSSGQILVFPGPTFDVSGGGLSSIGNALPEDIAVNLFDSGPLLLEAGTPYTVDLMNTGVIQLGFIGALEFTTVVPLPAPILLLGSALLGVVTVRRRAAS